MDRHRVRLAAQALAETSTPLAGLVDMDRLPTHSEVEADRPASSETEALVAVLPARPHLDDLDQVVVAAQSVIPPPIRGGLGFRGQAGKQANLGVPCLPAAALTSSEQAVEAEAALAVREAAQMEAAVAVARHQTQVDAVDFLGEAPGVVAMERKAATAFASWNGNHGKLPSLQVLPSPSRSPRALPPQSADPDSHGTRRNFVFPAHA